MKLRYKNNSVSPGVQHRSPLPFFFHNANLKGFNGMEKDDEVKRAGNSYDFGARMHDPRIGRFFAVDPLKAKYPDLSPYCFVANNPINAVDPDGKDIILIIYATPKGQSGHAVIAIENYRAVQSKVMENGIEVTKTKYEGTGTYTLYEFGPDVKLGLLKVNKDVPGYYGIKKNVSEADLLNKNNSEYESDEEFPNGADGVIKFDTDDYALDQKAKAVIEAKIKAQEKYNAVQNNCTDFAECVVEAATCENINSKESVKVPIVGKTLEISTPNTLYKKASELPNAQVVKSAGDKVDKTYMEGRKGKVENN